MRRSLGNFIQPQLQSSRRPQTSHSPTNAFVLASCQCSELIKAFPSIHTAQCNIVDQDDLGIRYLWPQWGSGGVRWVLRKILVSTIVFYPYPLNAECPNNTDSSCYYIKISTFAIPKLNHLRTLSVQYNRPVIRGSPLHDVIIYLYTQQCKPPAYTFLKACILLLAQFPYSCPHNV